MEFNKLSDWCKFLEKNFSNDVMIPTLPVIIRFDAVNFSKWTKSLDKPFDEGLSNLMIEATKFLTKETNAVISYTQSDEITLILYSSDKKSSIYNDGKKQKIVSKLTGMLVTFFNDERPKYLPNHNKTANFDCRIYQTPTLQDACAQLIWRENDAVRNSIQMLAQSLFSHNETMNLNTDKLQDKMFKERGVNWNDLETRFKRGTYVKRVTTSRSFTDSELENLPPKHKAHSDKDFKIERSIIEVVEIPIFTKVTNKVGVIFNDEKPILEYELV